MNTDQFKGKWVQFKGEVKKQWGKFTDDDLMQIEGDYDKFVGRVQERYGDKKDEIVRWADDWYRRQGQSSPAQREAQRPR
ncbi:MAG: CsbD family protein [Nitrospira sp.]|nr:CsbD family protein [Nitrospira sp.]MCC7470883.1 CsbD family protein [Candidatus Nomurabacteria bacterium]